MGNGFSQKIGLPIQEQVKSSLRLSKALISSYPGSLKYVDQAFQDLATFLPGQLTRHLWVLSFRP